MKQNHFIIPYSGNKRQEVETIHESLNLDGIETIIEPFCGTSAMSFYLSRLYPKRFKYILNDLDERLMELYAVMKDETKYNELILKSKEYYDFVFDNDLDENGKRERYNSLKTNNDLVTWVFMRTYYSFRAGVFPRFNHKKGSRDGRTKFMNYNIPIISFLRNEDIEFRCEDALNLVKQYKDNKSVLMFLDPPYFDCDNTFYKHQGLEIYPYLHETRLDSFKASIYLVVNLTEPIQNMFQEYFIKIYSKQYNVTRYKKVEHVIISNVNAHG